MLQGANRFATGVNILKRDKKIMQRWMVKAILGKIWFLLVSWLINRQYVLFFIKKDSPISWQIASPRLKNANLAERLPR